MYRLAILPSIFVNILWYIFGKGQSGVPGRAGWRQKNSSRALSQIQEKPLEDISPRTASWAMPTGETLGKDFDTQTGTRKAAYQPGSATV